MQGGKIGWLVTRPEEDLAGRRSLGEVEGGVWMMEEREGGGRAGSFYSQGYKYQHVYTDFSGQDRTRQDKSKECLNTTLILKTLYIFPNFL